MTAPVPERSGIGVQFSPGQDAPFAASRGRVLFDLLARVSPLESRLLRERR